MSIERFMRLQSRGARDRWRERFRTQKLQQATSKRRYWLTLHSSSIAVFLTEAARELGVDMTPHDWDELLKHDHSGGSQPLPSPSPTSQSEVKPAESILC